MMAALRMAFAALMVAGSAHAQSELTGPLSRRTRELVTEHTESSYLLPFSQISNLEPLRFEARISPHFLIAPRGWSVGAMINPGVTLRMYDQPSNPVRSPSYRPAVSFYVWPSTEVCYRSTVLYFSATYVHHSNGQEGPFFDSTGQVNHLDGSFAVNSLEFAAHWDQVEELGLTSGKVVLQYMPRAWQDSVLHDSYGLWRLRANLEWILHLPKVGGTWRLTAEPTIILGSVDQRFRNLNRIQASIQLAYLPAWSDQVGIMLSYYRGQDYYNIRFDERLHAVRIGVVGRLTATAR